MRRRTREESTQAKKAMNGEALAEHPGASEFLPASRGAKRVERVSPSKA